MKLLIAIQNLNGERWLAGCLAGALSVKACSYDDEVKIVMLDAGSSDRSIEIAGHFPEIEVIQHPMLWQSPAMNIVVKKYLDWFDWFGFVNNDDCYFPNFLQAHKKTIERVPDADLLHGYCAFYIEKNKGGDFRAIADGWEQAMRKGHNYITQPTILISRACFVKYGLFDEGIKHPFDFEYTSRVWKLGGKIEVTPEVVSFYRQRPDNMSHMFAHENVPEWREVGRRNCGVNN